MKLSKHFSVEELSQSDTALRLGIDNKPDPDVVNTLKRTAVKMEEVRGILSNFPIKINSGYRSPELNKAIGSSPTSQHCKGEAVDFTCHRFGTPYEISKRLVESSLDFDQLIYEGTWVHISFREDGMNRRETLTAKFTGGKVMYFPGIVD